MIRHLDLESTFISMVPNTKASGRTISSTEKALKSGQMVPYTKASTVMAKNKELACSNGPITANILDNFKIIISMAMALTSGVMDARTSVSG